ncbi:DUF2993 domain-containing protein [Micromonospora sp. HM5-17]|uniref:LmeA family phospholipid-binding protein n=1 Tax=Micromonospora sp. HM5-17 TaxID=2487710 RepID=UPI000F4607A5|nr:DUF2993 domain-containing protein [Micromonospora sp. HM5-17]ROT31888.1 DUF2993 domain-containing protein [Micromonospora sp. HM5-17]
MAESYPATGRTYRERPRRRRGRRLLVALAVVVLVLGALLAVADRVAAGVAGRVIADRVDQELTRRDVQSTAPEVTVGGFPFLTQVVNGRYDSIRIVLHDVRGPAGNGGVTVSVPEATVDARGVDAPLDALRSGRADIVAETVQGTCIVAYDSVVKLIDHPGVQLAEEGGNLVVTAPVEVPIINQRLTVRGNARLTPEGDDVLITFSDLTADDLPDNPAVRSFVEAFAEQLTVRLPLPVLPFPVEVTEIRPLPEGLRISGTARDVALNDVR